MKKNIKNIEKIVEKYKISNFKPDYEISVQNSYALFEKNYNFKNNNKLNLTLELNCLPDFKFYYVSDRILKYQNYLPHYFYFNNSLILLTKLKNSEFKFIHNNTFNISAKLPVNFSQNILEFFTEELNWIEDLLNSVSDISITTEFEINFLSGNIYIKIMISTINKNSLEIIYKKIQSKKFYGEILYRKFFRPSFSADNEIMIRLDYSYNNEYSESIYLFDYVKDCLELFTLIDLENNTIKLSTSLYECTMNKETFFENQDLILKTLRFIHKYQNFFELITNVLKKTKERPSEIILLGNLIKNNDKFLEEIEQILKVIKI